MLCSSNLTGMPPAAGSAEIATLLSLTPPHGRRADRNSPDTHRKMASSPQVLPRPADVMQNLSTFVQAATSPEQPRGCKQMVTQHLSHHAQQLCALSGGTHFSSKSPTQTSLRSLFTAAAARASTFTTNRGSGAGAEQTPTTAIVRTGTGTYTNLPSTTLRSLSECLSSPKRSFLPTPFTATSVQILNATTTAGVRTSAVQPARPLLSKQNQQQPQEQGHQQKCHHQQVQQQRQQLHQETRPLPPQQQRQVAQPQQQQHLPHQQQPSSQHKQQQQPQPQPQQPQQPQQAQQQPRRRESLDRDMPAVKAAGGPQACMRGLPERDAKIRTSPAPLPLAGPASISTKKNASMIIQTPEAGGKSCIEITKSEKEDVCGSALLPFGNFSPVPGVPTIPENTLVILDYDDTLLPTNWAAVQNRVALTDPVPAELLQPLAELSDTAIQTIDVCLNKAMVVIVTNASVEWVNRSGEKFIPTVLGHIEKQGIQVISARDRLQHTGLPQKQWKTKIFEELINDVFGERMRDGSECSVVSIGDGEGEREACLEMCRNLGIHEWLFKSLKLLSQPTCQQLSSQHTLIQQAFLDILKVRQSLDMAVLDYKNNVGGHSHHEDLSCVGDFPPPCNSHPEAQATVVGTEKEENCLQPLQDFEASTTAEPSSVAADRRIGVKTCKSVPNASHNVFHGESLFEGVLRDEYRGASQCRIHCPGAIHKKCGYGNYDAVTFPENTDAFVDLISDQLKAEHQPPASSSLTSPIPLRSGSLCAEEGDSAFVDNPRLLLA